MLESGRESETQNAICSSHWSLCSWRCGLGAALCIVPGPLTAARQTWKKLAKAVDELCMSSGFHEKVRDVVLPVHRKLVKALRECGGSVALVLADLLDEMRALDPLFWQTVPSCLVWWKLLQSASLCDAAAKLASIKRSPFILGHPAKSSDPSMGLIGLRGYKSHGNSPRVCWTFLRWCFGTTRLHQLHCFWWFWRSRLANVLKDRGLYQEVGPWWWEMQWTWWILDDVIGT